MSPEPSCGWPTIHAHVSGHGRGASNPSLSSATPSLCIAATKTSAVALAAVQLKPLQWLQPPQPRQPSAEPFFEIELLEQVSSLVAITSDAARAPS
eukprot:357379-Chlamydomonas_euryale.AAC.2